MSLGQMSAHDFCVCFFSKFMLNVFFPTGIKGSVPRGDRDGGGQEAEAEPSLPLREYY